MASVTQTIPSYTGGLSEQPDELKYPGQLSKADNVFPDITHGLMKRPGGKLVASLSDNGTASLNSVTTGKWFSYYRDDAEQYIGQIAQNGDVRIWKCSDGSAMTVTKDSGTASALTSYLTHTADSDIQTLTLNDYTYITNRTKTCAFNSTTTTAQESQAYIELRKLSYAQQYTINLFDNTDTQSVFTALRINVTREIDSGNGCKDADGGMPSSGTLPGSSSNQTRCDATATDDRDSYCPNVDTRIFSINDGDSGVAAAANGTAHTYDVYDVGDNNVSSLTGADARTPSNLYFRISTIGQAMPEGSATNPDYHCRYTTTHDLLYGGTGWKKGDYFTVWMKNARYKIEIAEDSESVVQANLALVRPTPTPFDTETVITAESILGDLRENLLVLDDVTITTAGSGYSSAPTVAFSGGGGTGAAATATVSGGAVTAITITNHGSGYTSAPTVSFSGGGGSSAAATARVFSAEQIGNGLYLSRPSGTAFNLSTTVTDLLRPLTKQVNDVGELPRQCKHGYRLKIANSAADEDDYYVQFYGNNDKDGEGVWEECAKPGVNTTFDPATMPIQLVRTNATTFTISQVTWDPRQVGDTLTNPDPSFIGKKINKMVFFRNRLVMLSDENVIMSRPGDFFNFWAKTAITYSATDAIDLSCSSEFPAIVYDAIQVNAGLLLFTANQQFMLTTDSDVLSPNTAKINSVSAYNFNTTTNPISLGTTTGWLDNAGKQSRFFEMTRLAREGEPTVIEQSKAVDKIFPKEIDLLCNSRENNLLLFAEKGERWVYGYRYFNTSENRLMQSWFKWYLSGTIQYMCMLDDAYYAVLRNNSKDVLQKFPIKLDDTSHFTTDDNDTTSDTSDDITYRVHLDNSKVIAASALGFSTSTERTGFTLPEGFNDSTQQLAVYCHSSGSKQGLYGLGTLYGTGSNTNVEFAGDWTGQDLIVGYLYDMEVKFPTIYFTQQQGNKVRSDVNGSLVVHRVKFNFGKSGVYQTVLKRIGKPDYTELHESKVTDSYGADTISFQEDQRRTVAIYEKNTNLDLTLKSTHASPATLFSMTWEGDYTSRFYRRV